MATIMEEIKVQSHDLVEQVKALIHEGNVRRIIIKDERGHTFVEIPLTIAAIGIVAAPILAGVAAIAGLVANFTVVIERAPEHHSAGPTPTEHHPAEPPTSEHPSGL